MAIQHRRGNFADFDPFKMLSGEFGYALDTEELYYCVAPGNVKRCATKEDIIEILETNQEAYDGLQQLLTELEDETVATGILADISQLLDDVATNQSKIATNTQGVADLDTRVSTHLAEKATANINVHGLSDKIIVEKGSIVGRGNYVRFGDGTQICWNRMDITIQANSAAEAYWIYPIAFYDKPMVTTSLEVGSTLDSYNVHLSNVLAGSSTAQANNRRSVSVSTTVAFIALGRWKA